MYERIADSLPRATGGAGKAWIEVDNGVSLHIRHWDRGTWHSWRKGQGEPTGADYLAKGRKRKA